MPRQRIAMDIVGQRFGKLYVKDFVEYDKHGRARYLCVCDCGKQSVVRRDGLLSGETTTCGNCSWIEEESGHYRYHCHAGGSFVFDKCDLPLVSAHRWLVDTNGYVRGTIDGNLAEFSRVILGAKKGEVVDHINRDKSDNRRCNLRIADTSKNAMNRKLSARNTTGYKGVTLEKSSAKRPYRAVIIVNCVKHSLGFFSNAADAANAYDEAARRYFGEFARVNFPRDGERGCRDEVI